MSPLAKTGLAYSGFRMLLVHAHPDDETINNGVTMAMYQDLGVQVTLVTCTRGEEGEVLVPGLSHLASSESDQLGDHRIIELAAAMKELGISDYRFLGADKIKFRDSGMMGTEPNTSIRKHGNLKYTNRQHYCFNK